MKKVASLCVEEKRKREQISGYTPQGGYVSLLFKRWTELFKSEIEDDKTEGAAELESIRGIMKEVEAGLEIQMAIQWLRNRLFQKVTTAV